MSQAAVPGIEWATEASRAGEPTLRIGERFVHSRYAPRREAESFARGAAGELPDGSGLVLLGLGLGYVPEALAAAGADAVAFDPFPEITGELGAQRVPSPVPVVSDLEALDRWLEARPGRRRGSRLLLHPGYSELCRFEARVIAARLVEAARSELGGGAREPLRVRDAVVSERAIDALERIPYLRTAAELAGCCAGRTALCISPGPSLDAEALAALRRREGGVVFAALQALRPLEEAGVTPDFVVAPDPHEFESFVEGLAGDFGVLLADSSVRPALLDRWPGKTVLFHLETPHLHQVAWQRAGLPVLAEPVTTVSETMLALAAELGAARFVLAGMDFCGEPKRYRQLSFAARDAAGRRVVTNGHYLAGARYLSRRCPELAASGRPVARIGQGLPIAGCEPAEPEALAVGPEPPLELRPGKADRATLWRACRDVLARAEKTPGAAGPAKPRGEGRAARRMEPFHPLEPKARRTRLARARARLEAEPPLDTARDPIPEPS